MLLYFIFQMMLEAVSLVYSIRWPIAIVALGGLFLILGYYIYVNSYFRGSKFRAVKNVVRAYVDNCNELNCHIEELKKSYVGIRSQKYGVSSLKDDSNYDFKRTEWSNDRRSEFVHSCSMSVCKNADNQPLKYLCKYFDIDLSEQSLVLIEGVLNDFLAAEEGKDLLIEERQDVLCDVWGSIPWVIRKFNLEKLVYELGFEYVDMSDLHHPVYTFLYVSAGGNSSMKCEIKLDISNLENLTSYIRSRVEYRKSTQGQRALMTSKLREEIKERDCHKCQMCGLSTEDERNLLLEIDHIIPISKGGITSKNNLQTLCWKCNRRKGAKIL